MTRDTTPFDHRPDPALGSALRDALAAGDDAAFIARVLAQAGRPAEAHWDVLASWARIGIAAAAAAALLAGVLVGRGARAAPSAPAASVDELLAGAAGPSGALVTSPQPPDPSVLFASAEER
jgi:hypothetical protein